MKKLIMLLVVSCLGMQLHAFRGIRRGVTRRHLAAGRDSSLRWISSQLMAKQEKLEKLRAGKWSLLNRSKIRRLLQEILDLQEEINKESGFYRESAGRNAFGFPFK